MLPTASQSAGGQAAQMAQRNGHPEQAKKLPSNTTAAVLPTKELAEARSRITQMEKTMRWWSDCTVAWREKWQRTRNERNALKKELKDLQKTFDELSKAYTSLRRDTESKITSLMHQIYEVSAAEKENAMINDYESHMSGGGKKKFVDGKTQVEADDIPAALMVSISCQVDDLDEKRTRKRSDSAEFSFLETALAQADSERQTLLETISKLNEEIAGLRDSLTAAREAQSRNNTQSFNESSSSSLMITSLHEHSEVLAQQTGELQQRLERLQSENAVEYARREQLESEKMALERENKQLKTTVTDLQTQVQALRTIADRTRHLSSATATSSVQSLGISQSSLAGSVNDQDSMYTHQSGASINREFAELRTKYANAKRLLKERAADAEHQTRRIEAYELEVKHLRNRINEVKEALRVNEDELDAERTATHRLERVADDLRAELDRTRVELDYFNRRSLHAGAEPVNSVVSLNEPRRIDPAVPTGGIRFTERASSCGVAPLGVDFSCGENMVRSDASVETMTDSATPRTLSSRETSAEPDVKLDSMQDACTDVDHDVVIQECSEDATN